MQVRHTRTSAASDGWLIGQAAQFSGGNPEPSLERSRECTRGLVADRCGDLGEGRTRGAKALTRETQSQLRKEGEWRNADCAAEDTNEGRPRHMRLDGKLIKCPVVRWSCQHGGHRSGRLRR